MMKGAVLLLDSPIIFATRYITAEELLLGDFQNPVDYIYQFKEINS